jgi:predicted ester cyclase
MSRKERIESFVNAINAQDFEKIAALLHAKVIRHAQPPFQEQLIGREAFLGFLMREAATFPDAVERILLLVEEGSHIAARLHFRGTQTGALGPFAPSGRVLEAEFVCIFRMEAGRIAEVWAQWDNLNALVQLGHYAV